MDELLTPRLRIRPLRDADLDAMWADMSAPEVTRPAGGYLLADRSACARRLTAMIQQGSNLAVALRGSDQLIGTIGLYQIPQYPPYRRMVGFALGQRYWGQGYIPEACHALFRLAFSRGVTEIIGNHFIGNHASQRVLEKLGFLYRETLYDTFAGQDGTHYDEVSYLLTRQRYEDLFGTLGD
ncbi:MAG: GNAT family N-acetyltransferase [Eubacteriales bacterium]|nr:GNAT family N-acetyltransferase [Eubacteriales bacterium]